MTTKTLALILATTTLALGACSKKAPEQLPPTPVETGTGTGEVPTDTASGPGTQDHFATTVGATNTVVYFALDQYDIDAEDAGKLQTQARYFSQYPDVSFTIEGHADERGTREYNLALGERRANAAKNYLVSLGIPADRIRTLSYGKERPVALGSDEGSWAQNRRAATVVIN